MSLCRNERKMNQSREKINDYVLNEKFLNMEKYQQKNSMRQPTFLFLKNYI